MRSSQPLHRRVTRLVVTAISIGMATGVTAFLASDLRYTMQAETARLQSSASAFAAVAADPVASSDRRGTLEVLRGVKSLPSVNYVLATDITGTPIAEIGLGVALIKRQDAGLLADLSALTHGHLSVTVPVTRAGRQVGALRMDADMSGLLMRYAWLAGLSGLASLALVISTALLVRWQARRMLAPLRDLAAEFEDIGRRQDLKRRLAEGGNDEVGTLISAFNDMFVQIDARDEALEKHRANLEITVEERTADLRIAKEAAEAANQAKSTFLSTMSHEIRTPMNGMLVMAEMLAAAPLSPRHRRYAEIINRSGRNLVHIINDILDFSKIESGRIELENVPYSIDSVLEDIACLFSERAAEKGLTLSVFIAPDVPHTMTGDPTRLSQIIGNLVNNGLKFTETGGVAMVAQMVGERLRIDVRDTGIGISKDQIGRIFERFSQADSSITRKFGGTGLGLSIARQLAELMGGELGVESVPGEGSTFRAELPLMAAERVSPAEGQGLAVLLIDSNPLSRKATEDGLLARGVRVLADGAGAHVDAVMIRAGESLPDTVPEHVPVVLLRPFAAVSASLIRADADLALPLGRSALDRLIMALRQGDSLEQLSSLNDARAPDRPPSFGGLKVLVVDDVAVNREVLNETLASFDIQPDLADGGEAAIERAAAKRFDVIFMDCSMPGMDGYEATRRIRALPHGAEPLIIALTGHALAREGGEWSTSGMNDFIIKPFTIEAIAKVLKTISTAAGPVIDVETRIDAIVPPPAAKPETVPALELSEPLLNPETLAMFDTLRASSGIDMRPKVFGMFRAAIPEAIRGLKGAIGEAGAAPAALVHALKSNCTSAGAGRAGALCQLIETRLKAGAELTTGDVGALADVLADTLDAMDGMMGTGDQATVQARA